MGSRKIDSQVRILLTDTILALCKNTLNQYGEVAVEGLLGITLDKKEIFLVSLQEVIRNNKGGGSKRSERSKSKHSDDSEATYDSDDSTSSRSKRKRRKKHKRSRSTDNEGTPKSKADVSIKLENVEDDDLYVTKETIKRKRPNVGSSDQSSSQSGYSADAQMAQYQSGGPMRAAPSGLWDTQEETGKEPEYRKIGQLEPQFEFETLTDDDNTNFVISNILGTCPSKSPEMYAMSENVSASKDNVTVHDVYVPSGLSNETDDDVKEMIYVVPSGNAVKEESETDSNDVYSASMADMDPVRSLNEDRTSQPSNLCGMSSRSGQLLSTRLSEDVESSTCSFDSPNMSSNTKNVQLNFHSDSTNTYTNLLDKFDKRLSRKSPRSFKPTKSSTITTSPLPTNSRSSSSRQESKAKYKFKCPICDISYSRKWVLGRHMAQHGPHAAGAVHRKSPMISPAQVESLKSQRTCNQQQGADQSIEESEVLSMDKSIEKSIDKSVEGNVDESNEISVEQTMEEPREDFIEKSIETFMEDFRRHSEETPTENSADDRAASGSGETSIEKYMEPKGKSIESEEKSIEPKVKSLESLEKSIDKSAENSIGNSVEKSADKASEQNKFKCAVCQRNFNRKWLMQRHTEQVHAKGKSKRKPKTFLPQRPEKKSDTNKCKVCGLSCKSKADLEVHTKTHISQCFVCGQAFNRMWETNEHIRTCHPEVFVSMSVDLNTNTTGAQ